MDGRMIGWIGGRMEGWKVVKCKLVKIKGWKDGFKDDRKDGWKVLKMEEWKDGRV